MKSMLRVGVLVLALVGLGLGSLGAQSSILRGGAAAQPVASSLTVTTNAPNSQIMINGEFKAMAPATINLRPGTYQITVSAPGFQDYSGQVIVNGPTTVNIPLASNTFALNIISNAQNAQVFVDGNSSPGGGRFGPGNHQIRVSAPGYNDYTATVNLSQDTNLNASLNPMLYQLMVSTNAPGAQILVDGNPYQNGAAYPPGNHSLSVSAPGYQSANSVINLNQSATVNVSLNPAFAILRVVVPQNYIDKRQGFDPRDARIALYIDNQKQPFADTQVMPGTHTITFVLGNLSVTGSYTFNPGQVYLLQPQLGLSVQQAQ